MARRRAEDSKEYRWPGVPLSAYDHAAEPPPNTKKCDHYICIFCQCGLPIWPASAVLEEPPCF